MQPWLSSASASAATLTVTMRHNYHDNLLTFRLTQSPQGWTHSRRMLDPWQEMFETLTRATLS